MIPSQVTVTSLLPESVNNLHTKVTNTAKAILELGTISPGKFISESSWNQTPKPIHELGTEGAVLCPLSAHGRSPFAPGPSICRRFKIALRLVSFPRRPSPYKRRKELKNHKSMNQQLFFKLVLQACEASGTHSRIRGFMSIAANDFGAMLL
ncbi:hypothetical protein SCA6_005597 [Theobroma cacao]